MRRRGHTLRLTAVSALVVLALTGFSTSRGHGHGSGHGGGCSSSSQDHDSSSSSSGGTSGSRYHDYDDDDDYTGDDSYGSGGDTTSTTMPQQDAVVTLVSCASAEQPYATVELHNPNDRAGTFDLTVTFVDAGGEPVDVQTDQVDVPANDTVTVKEYVAGDAASVDHCDTDDLASPAS